MMENYEDIRLGHVRSKDVCNVREVRIGEGTDFLDYGSQTQNLNFGAEILSTKITTPTTSPLPPLSPMTEVASTTAAVEFLSPQPTTTEATSEEHNKTNAQTKTKILLYSGTGIRQQQQQEDEQQQQNEAHEVFDVNINCARRKSSATANSESESSEDNGEEEEEQQKHKRFSTRTDSQSSSTTNNQSGPTDDSTTDTDCSEVSGLSEMTDSDWKPNPYHLRWIQRQMHSGRDPRDLLSIVLPNGPPPELTAGSNDMMLWHMLSSMLSSYNEHEPRRHKLRNINTFEDVIQLVRNSQKIIVLTGAGVSVSCGIPDFRSSNGIYSRLARDFPDLPDPQAMFDINYFSRDPRPFFKFAREIYPGQFEPSPGHRFIKMLETKGKLLRNYTQNIDTLEQVAGIRNVIECHGSFSTASCTKCRFKCSADDIRNDIFSQRIPVCPQCQPVEHESVAASGAVTEMELKQLVENGIMKPDIVFFGEGLPEEFHTVMATDKEECDLLIVMGSSLKVRPVNYIPSSIPVTVPQILINREKLHHLEFDVELLGDSDVIINQLCHRLGDDWQEICYDSNVLQESKELQSVEDEQTSTLLQDIDTQSLKSNGSGDFIMGSAGTCSDSGFESSTFSTVNLRHDIVTNLNATEAIEKIKTDILVELNEVTPSQTPLNGDDDMLEILDDQQNDNCNGIQQQPSDTTESFRHLSVDSSKDSGIEPYSGIELSNLPQLIPPYENFGDEDAGVVNENTFPTPPPTTTASASNNDDDIDDTPDPIEEQTQQQPYKLQEPQAPPQKRRSAAERLAPGTFYCLGNNRSYVFPGAQVFLDNDFDYAVDDSDEEEPNEIFEEDDDGDTDEVDDDLPSLLPPPPPPLPQTTATTMETQNLITNDISNYAAAAAAASTATTTITSHSPSKKRRSSIQHDCVGSSTSSNNNSVPMVYAYNNAAAAEKLAAEAAAAICQSTANNSSSLQSSTSNCTYTNADEKPGYSATVCSPPPLKKRRSSYDKKTTAADTHLDPVTVTANICGT